MEKWIQIQMPDGSKWQVTLFKVAHVLAKRDLSYERKEADHPRPKLTLEDLRDEILESLETGNDEFVKNEVITAFEGTTWKSWHMMPVSGELEPPPYAKWWAHNQMKHIGRTTEKGRRLPRCPRNWKAEQKAAQEASTRKDLF